MSEPLALVPFEPPVVPVVPLAQPLTTSAMSSAGIRKEKSFFKSDLRQG